MKGCRERGEECVDNGTPLNTGRTGDEDGFGFGGGRRGHMYVLES